jgi:3-deoxy-7-phosphoheptulonate synthase
MLESKLKTSRSYKNKDTIINVRDTKIGGSHFAFIAGPCAIENQDQYYTTAKSVISCGANIIRGSVFKPRTNPHSFQGLGRSGLKLIKDLSEDLDVVVETEVMDPRDVKITSKYVDILRVGTRNMQNYDLLKELSKINNPIILKRGMCATIDEWLQSAEYLMFNGNENIILCERGIRTFETELRNTLDLGVITILKSKTHLPIIIDPSHATGKRELVLPMSKASIVSGANGLMIEVHNCPNKALCDGKQSLTLDDFEHLSKKIKPLLDYENKTI